MFKIYDHLRAWVYREYCFAMRWHMLYAKEKLSIQISKYNAVKSIFC